MIDISRLGAEERLRLDRRLDELDRDGPEGIPWEDVVQIHPRLFGAECLFHVACKQLIPDCGTGLQPVLFGQQSSFSATCCAVFQFV